MHPERGHICRLLLLFVISWAALAVVIGALNKADVDLELGDGGSAAKSATEIALKMCAVIFTAVAAAVGAALHRPWRRLPVHRIGFEPRSSEKPGYPLRAPPYGFSLLRALQIMIV